MRPLGRYLLRARIPVRLRLRLRRRLGLRLRLRVGVTGCRNRGYAGVVRGAYRLC
jgi:hypothetical protein